MVLRNQDVDIAEAASSFNRRVSCVPAHSGILPLRAGFMDMFSNQPQKQSPQEASAETEAGLSAEQDPSDPSTLSLPVLYAQGERGKRGGFRVDYTNLLAGINWASDAAARDGVWFSLFIPSILHGLPASQQCPGNVQDASPQTSS